MSIHRYGSFNEEFLSGLRRKISQAFTGDRTKPEKNQDDLAKEILDHLKSLPKNYNATGEFDENTVNRSGADVYTFFMNFRRDSAYYKVDVRKHIDHRTTSQPEYTVTINKMVKRDESKSDKDNTHGDEPENNRENGKDQERGNDQGGEPNDATPQTPSQENPIEGRSSATGPQKKKFCFYLDDFLKAKEDIRIAKNLIVQREFLKLKKRWVAKSKKSTKYKNRDIEDLSFWNGASGGQIKAQLLTLARQKAEKLAPELFKESFQSQYNFVLEGGINFGGGKKVKLGPSDGHYRAVDTSKTEYLKCSQGIARDIFNKAVEIWRATHKTASGDARGGRNL